jgi:hypothetical protein
LARGEETKGPPSKRERADTARAIRNHTEKIKTGGLVIRWSNLTEAEARRLVDLTKANNRSTRAWWPLVLRGVGAPRRSKRSV